MAMFGNSPQKPKSAPAVHTLLGKDTLWKGEVHCGPQSLRVEGRIEGSIHSTGEVTVGDLAREAVEHLRRQRNA